MFNIFKRKEKIRQTEQSITGFSGRLSLFFSYFWNLMTANLIFIALCIPIVTIPAAVAGLTGVSKKILGGGITYTSHEFFKVFKRDFKLATIYGWLSILCYAAVTIGIRFYNSILVNYWWGAIPMGISLFLLVALVASNSYAFLLITSVELNFANIIKNSFLLALVGIKKTAIVLLTLIAFAAASFVIFPYSVAILALVGFAAYNFVCSACCMGVVEKYVIQPFYEKREQGEGAVDTTQK